MGWGWTVVAARVLFIADDEVGVVCRWSANSDGDPGAGRKQRYVIASVVLW